ncbi:MAG: GDYXXLXY domain-containing protein [Candidatus Vogelbacteria bacterium]|nr:GDYXXLXY domain-containing protein [Candidatus Vogelbacteria bacterium]
MENKKTIKLIVAVVIQVAIILTLVIFNQSITANGSSVLLRIAPVDPRDPLRGDFVTYQYEISRLSAYQFEGGAPVNGQDVYVELVQRGKYYLVERASSKRPESGLVIRGVVERGGRDTILATSTPDWNNQTVLVKYGIEEAFIPEGSGWTLPSGEAYARVKVAENGNARVVGIYINDKPWP